MCNNKKENIDNKIDNNDLYKKLKKWALLNLEELTITIISNKINEILKDVILEDTSFCQQYNLTYPVKMSSIHRWIDDMKFKYCPAKKSYMINIHEREDIKVDHKKYITKFK